MKFKWAYAVCACVIWAVFPAQGVEPVALTLPQALSRAREANPLLAGFVFEERVQQARSRGAGLRRAPELEVLVEDAAGTGARAGLDAAQSTLSLGQVFELGGKRQGRLDVAAASHALLRTGQAARQLDVFADVARRFVRMLALQERERAAQDAVDLARRVQAAVDERVRAAASPEAERSRALVAAAEAELELEDVQHSLRTARHELAGAIGLPEPDFSVVAGDLFATPSPPSFDALGQRLEAAPDFLRFADEARLRDAELRLAEAQRSADVRATLGARRYEENGDAAFLAGVSLPLFAGARGAAAAAVAAAGRDRVAVDRKAALIRARTHLFAQHQEMEHARHVVRALRDQVMSHLARALEQTEYAYRRGRYSYLEWGDAQRRHLDARNRYIEAAAEYHIHKIEIERLTGESLAQPGDPS